jgi:hypothetical protein
VPVERAQEGERLFDPRLQFVKRCLGVLVARRLDAGEPRRAVLGLIAEALHLTREREHVGAQPQRRIDRRIEFGLLGVRGRFGEHAHEGGQAHLKSADAGLI